MTKKEILKMTGLSESDFYKKYPTQESFMMEYGGKIAGYESGGKISYSAKDAAAGKDIGKPGKNFSKIAAEAGERYGSKEAGQRVAGAILAKLRGKRKDGGKITPDEFVKKYYGEKYQSDKDPKTGEDLKGYDYWRNRILSEVDLPLNEDGDIMFESVSDILKRMESANPQGKGFLQVPINQTVVKELMEEQSDLYDTPENVNYNLVKENVKLNAVKNPANPVRPFGWGYDEGSMDGGYKKGGSITPTPTGDIFDMMGMSYLNSFANGGDIDVKAPLYDETELNTNINTNLYASGGYTPMYAGGSYIPMYGFGNWVKDVGKLTLNNLAAPLEHVSGNNFVNFDYDNKAMADAAAISEGLSGAATDIVGTTFLGPAYGMAKGQVQGVTRNLGSSSEEQKGASKAANQIGQIAGSTGDLISGISSGNVQQIVGGAGNVLGTTGQQLGSQELGAVGQLTGTASQFVGSGKSTPSTTGMGPMGDMVSPQNAMGFFAKNGGNVPAYMQNMRKFAQGGMTVGNVEGKELLIDPYKLEAGGVPKILADYTNIPRHPSDGSIDERGTVPLPVNKYVITNAMRGKFDKAKQSNDGLWSSAIMNKIDFDKNKKEQQEMQKASNAYGRFMAKYGGTIEKMYACGGKTYGCGGMTKYDDGGGTPSYPLNMTGPRDILPLMFTDPYVAPVNNNIGLTTPVIGSSLPQGGLQLSLPSSGAPALPADWNSGMRSGVLTEPRLNTPAMGSSLPQGWQLQNPSADDGWKLDANLSPARVDLSDGPMTLMEPLGPTGSQSAKGPVGSKRPGSQELMVSRRDPSDYLGQQYGMNPSVLGQIAPMIPALALGLEAALSKPYQVKASDYMVNERLKPEKISPNYRPIYEAENRAAYDIAQMAPGSGGYLAGRTALNANTKKVIADYKKALEDEYVKQKLGADQFNITKDLQNAQTKFAVDQFNEENKAARRTAMREQFGKNLPAAFFNQQYNNMGMQAIQAQYPFQQFNWGIFGKSNPV